MTKIISHRFQTQASIRQKNIVENSLDALDLALSLGVRAFEFDVMMSMDNELFINHDDVLGRLHPDLAGKHFLELSNKTLKQYHFALLDDVLAKAQIYDDIWLNIEVKIPEDLKHLNHLKYLNNSNEQYYDLLLEKLLKKIKTANLDAMHFVISSFDVQVLKKINHLSPELPIAALAHTNAELKSILAQCATGELNPVALHLNHQLFLKNSKNPQYPQNSKNHQDVSDSFDELVLEDLQKRFSKIRLYTINDSNLAVKLTRRDCDIFSDILA
jgi:glycerophosphoryl diester phosphodiesterase